MNAYEELRHAAETAVADLKTGVSDTGFIVRYLLRALKTPPRNCNVGTAESQIKRFFIFCGDYVDCVKCPCYTKDCSAPTVSCFAKWAQMPYKKGGEA